MKKFFLLSALAFSVLFGKAQIAEMEKNPAKIEVPKNNKGDLRSRIEGVITRHKDMKLLEATPRNHVHIISVAVAFDANGKVDTVLFSKKMSRATAAMVRPNAEFTKKVKSYNWTYKEYGSKVVVFPILFIRIGDKNLDYDSGFLTDFESIWPDNRLYGKREVVLLNPFVSQYSMPIP